MRQWNRACPWPGSASRIWEPSSGATGWTTRCRRPSPPSATVTLTVVDDIGLLPISQDAAEGLYRLVDAAYERRSLALSSNLHPSGFDQLMDKTIASALVDRSCTTPT